MGTYDTVLVPCPKCGEKSGFQSKSGDCVLGLFELEDAPEDVLSDVNRHAPNTCGKCGTAYRVKVDAVPIPGVVPDRVPDSVLKEILEDKGWGAASGHPVEDLATWRELVQDLKSARDQIKMLTGLRDGTHKAFRAYAIVESTENLA